MGLTADEKKGLGRLNAGDHAGSKTAASISHWFGFLIRKDKELKWKRYRRRKQTRSTGSRCTWASVPRSRSQGKAMAVYVLNLLLVSVKDRDHGTARLSHEHQITSMAKNKTSYDKIVIFCGMIRNSTHNLCLYLYFDCPLANYSYRNIDIHHDLQYPKIEATDQNTMGISF